MTLITSVGYRSRRNLAKLRAIRDDLARIGLEFEWKPLDEKMLRMEDLSAPDQEWFRARCGQGFDGQICP